MAKKEFNPFLAQQFIEEAVAKRETPDLKALFSKMETPDEAKKRLGAE